MALLETAYLLSVADGILAGIVKSAIVAAVVTALAWLFIDQMNADLARRPVLISPSGSTT